MLKIKTILTYLLFFPFEFVFSWIAGIWISDQIHLGEVYFDYIFLLLVLFLLLYVRCKLPIKIKWGIYFPALVLFAILVIFKSNDYFELIRERIHQGN